MFTMPSIGRDVASSDTGKVGAVAFGFAGRGDNHTPKAGINAIMAVQAIIAEIMVVITLTFFIEIPYTLLCSRVRAGHCILKGHDAELIFHDTKLAGSIHAICCPSSLLCREVYLQAALPLCLCALMARLLSSMPFLHQTGRVYPADCGSAPSLSG